MANEAVIIELHGNGGEPYRFTVADGTTIEKGTILKLSGDNTAIASSSNDVFAGIAAAEKVANDGATTIAAYTKGRFDLKVAGNPVGLGNVVVLSGANLITPAVAADLLLGKAIGVALEAGDASEVIAVEVGSL